MLQKVRFGKISYTTTRGLQLFTTPRPERSDHHTSHVSWIQEWRTLRFVETNDPADIPELAPALRPLGLKATARVEFVEKYGKKNTYEDGVEKFTKNISDPKSHIFKAMMRVAGGVEMLVGLSEWYVGFLDIAKIDPFAEKPVEDARGVAETVAEEKLEERGILEMGTFSTELDGQYRDPNPYVDMVRRMGNAYVGTIRGKKHVILRRLVVHPDFQRRGIGRKLMQWGLDEADRLGIVSWLFARPAGIQLYQRCGYVEVANISFDIPDGDPAIDAAPFIGMLRKAEAAKTFEQ